MRWMWTMVMLVAALLAVSPAQAATVPEILARIDSNLTFESRESWITMTVTKGDRVKVYKMHSYGRGQEEAAVEYLEPARDKGTKMLKKGSELWMWMPSVEKVQKISGHMLRQSMMGSDMSYEDLMQAAKWQTMYDGTILGEETIDGRKCWKIELKATASDVSYPKRMMWVDQATYVPMKQELYALSGTLLKTWTMTEVKTFGTRQFPMRMVIEDKLQQGSKTEIVFTELKFAVPLQAEVFDVRWLER